MEGGGRRVWMTEEEFDVFSTLKQLESASLERRGLNLCSTNMHGGANSARQSKAESH